MKEIQVNDEQSNQRLDVFCADFTQTSRARIAQMIKQGDILVNQEMMKPAYLIQENDVITIDKITIPEINLEPHPMDLDILYEDEYILVINKPQGMVVHPSATQFEPTLVQGLMAHTKLSSIGQDAMRPGIVHRLDKDTSGALVVAKTDEAHHHLASQLKDHSMTRLYWVIVSGVFNHQKALVDAPIGRDPKLRQQMMVTHINSKEAKTHFTLIETFDEHSLLEARLETGRTHQIRVHAQYMKFPVLSDPVYGYRKEVEDGGQYLHAKQLVLTHPVTSQQMTFEAPVPERFNNKLKELRHE